MQEILNRNILYNVGVGYVKADVQTRSSFSISTENQILLFDK